MRRAACLALVLLASLLYAGTAAAFGGSTPLAGATSEVTASVTPGGVSVATTVSTSSPVAPPVSVAASVTVPQPGSTSVSVSGTPTPVSVSEAVVPAGPAAPVPAAKTPTAVHRIVRAQRPSPAQPSSRVVRPVRRTNPVAAIAYRRVAAPTKRVVVRATKPHASGAVFPQLGGERQPSPTGTGAAGGGAGIAFVAILASFLFLAASWCGRRLRPSAELARPPALFSLLERPG